MGQARQAATIARKIFSGTCHPARYPGLASHAGQSIECKQTDRERRGVLWAHAEETNSSPKLPVFWASWASDLSTWWYCCAAAKRRRGPGPAASRHGSSDIVCVLCTQPLRLTATFRCTATGLAHPVARTASVIEPLDFSPLPVEADLKPSSTVYPSQSSYRLHC